MLTYTHIHTRTQWQSVQFSSVAQLCPTLCNPMNCSTPGLPVHHQLPELAQTLIHWVGDAIQPSHPLSSPSPPAFNLSQHQDLFKWVSSSHQVAKYSTFNQRENSVTPGRPFAQPAITGSMWQVARLPRTLLRPHCLLDADLRTTTHKEDSPGMPTSVCVLGCFWPAGSHVLTSQSACVTR